MGLSGGLTNGTPRNNDSIVVKYPIIWKKGAIVKKRSCGFRTPQEAIRFGGEGRLVKLSKAPRNPWVQYTSFGSPVPGQFVRSYFMIGDYCSSFWTLRTRRARAMKNDSSIILNLLEIFVVGI
jgi:hypothetical protein